jgi:hypothetical protein
MFIQIPPAFVTRNLFSFLLHSKRLTNNPLFEVISLHVPLGPLWNKPFLASRFCFGIETSLISLLKTRGHIKPIEQDDKIIAAKMTVYACDSKSIFPFVTSEAYQAPAIPKCNNSA